ncbi:hypothetical protein [Bartonella elizabethae]|nr:hypothetical protein [Bartonella elizabethae]
MVAPKKPQSINRKNKTDGPQKRIEETRKHKASLLKRSNNSDDKG